MLFELLIDSHIFNTRIPHASIKESIGLLFGHKTKLNVDLGELIEKKESLSDFLHSKLNVNINVTENKLLIDSETISPQDLQRMVSKFIYHQNLNNMHYTALEGSTVKISTFKGVNKKSKKAKSNVPHQTAAQSWGL